MRQCADPAGRCKAGRSRAVHVAAAFPPDARGTRVSIFPFARKALEVIEQPRCPCGGTGRRARLKIVFRKECGFNSLHGHQKKSKTPSV